MPVYQSHTEQQSWQADHTTGSISCQCKQKQPVRQSCQAGCFEFVIQPESVRVSYQAQEMPMFQACELHVDRCVWIIGKSPAAGLPCQTTLSAARVNAPTTV